MFEGEGNFIRWHTRLPKPTTPTDLSSSVCSSFVLFFGVSFTSILKRHKMINAIKNIKNKPCRRSIGRRVLWFAGRPITFFVKFDLLVLFTKRTRIHFDHKLNQNTWIHIVSSTRKERFERKSKVYLIDKKNPIRLNKYCSRLLIACLCTNVILSVLCIVKLWEKWQQQILTPVFTLLLN